MGSYDNYFTSCTLMALSIVNDPAHAGARERMKAFLLTLQRKEEGRLKGGFGYNTAQGADLSNAQFAIAALRAAGIPETHEAMVRARAFLARAQNRSENEENKDASYEMQEKDIGIVKVVPGNDGSAGYEPGVSKAGLERLPDGTYVARGYGSMTYALLKCYLLAGVSKEDERVKAAIGWLAKNYTWDENPGFRKTAEETKQQDAPYWGLYYYYMTAAKALQLAQVEKLETPAGPRDWKADLAQALLSRQQADGSWKNEKSPRWDEADPLLTTTYAVIALEEIRAAR
jgi:squalene-hopene/tetraprenyl-beta-curcumene cyclase